MARCPVPSPSSRARRVVAAAALCAALARCLPTGGVADDSGAGPSDSGDSALPDSGAPDPADVPPCQGPGECPPAPTGLAHAAWYDRLTESPTVTWTAAGGTAVRYEIAVGRTAGATDVARWTDAGTATSYTFRALWLRNGGRYYPSVRSVSAQGVRSPSASTDGWRVDVVAPEGAMQVDDRRAARGQVRWDAATTDAQSGLAGFRVAVGTTPGAADVVAWRDVGMAHEATLALPAAVVGQRYYAAVRAVDVAGNASLPVSSAGWLGCPPNFVFVPGNPTPGIGTDGFCVARYEMKIRGDDNGDQPYATVQGRTAESRPTGTPWSGLETPEALIECAELGEGFGLITNPQWQTIARDIEATASNWSGGAVGAGLINRGHSDGTPAAALAAGADTDPCAGTGQTHCADPASPEWEQKRTHTLSTGETLWDFAGNQWEVVTSAPPGPSGLWQDFDSAPFVSAPGFEQLRTAFAPLGRWTSAQGVGRIYGGASMTIRGGGAVPMSVGTAGSLGVRDAGVFATNHNAQSGVGFRCVFTR